MRHAFPGFALDAAFDSPIPGTTVLFGPSGCGKSTVLAAVAGLLRPERGRVALGDTVLLDTARGLALPAERRRCGVVFQDSRLFPHLSVEGNLRYGLRRAPRGATGPGFEEVVALLGIGPLLRRRPIGLSGGERQRVALGRALLSRPRLLLMDEPLAALDAARKAEVLPFLERVRQRFGLPILYVTHALDEVDRLADTLVLMGRGTVLASGPVEELSTRPDLPLAARRDAGAVLACTVAGHDQERGLTRLRFPDGEVVVALRDLPLGAALRVRVRARDVSVATSEPRDLSVQNILPATVGEVTPLASGQEATLSLRVGGSTLLARVTRDAVERLGLAPGRPVWALVKSISFDHGAAGGGAPV
nr:molybdenum ABC transporter ATP-binding protein [Roseomonas acroporae]